MNSLHFKRFIQFSSLLLLCFGLNRQQTISSNGMQIGLSCNITINGTCYIYVSTPMNWTDAEDNCISMGGHLASIHSDAESTALQGIRPNLTGLTIDSPQNPFIGCNDKMSEGNFSWTDNSDFSYTNWVNGQPNNINDNQDCCSIMYNSDKWNDRRCIEMFHSICQVAEFEEPPVNASEVRDSLLNIIEDAIIQPESLISVNMIKNILEEANTLIEYSTQQISQNQSEFIDDIILITRLIELISQQAYNITQNSSVEPIRIKMSSINLQIDLVSKEDLFSNNSTDISFQTTSNDDEIEMTDAVYIPTSLLLPLFTSSDSRIIITSFLIQVNLNEDEPLRLNQIASNIFGLSITGIEPGENLKQPIQFKFQTKTIINNPLCSFLMEDSSYWSKSGVELIQTSLNMTVCETSHLTSFAVLAGSNTQYSPTENLILHILSYVLLTISLLFLLVALGAFFYSSRLVFRLEANIMYFNYGLALALAIFTFILGAELHRLNSPIPCIIISFFIHYIWLVVFASSMALSVLIFYVTWLSNIESDRRFIAPYLIVAAWSIPLIITVAMGVPMLTAEKDIIGNHSFLTKNSCILSSVVENRVLNWYTIPFYALIFIMIIVNAVVLILTLVKIYKVLKKRSKSSSTQNYHFIIFRTMAISALILLPILGVPWIISPIIAYTTKVYFLSTFLDWIFILLNCPVGVAFFVITFKIDEIKFPFFKAKPATSNTLPISSASKPIKKRRFVAAKPATTNSTTIINSTTPITNSTTISTTTAISISNEVDLNTEIYKSSVSSSALVNIIDNPTTIFANPNAKVI